MRFVVGHVGRDVWRSCHGHMQEGIPSSVSCIHHPILKYNHQDTNLGSSWVEDFQLSERG